MEFIPVEKLKEMIGQEMGVSDWIQIDQGKINQFAECTGDHQWIHVDVEKAKQGPFGGPIAHGFLTLTDTGFERLEQIHAGGNQDGH